MVDLKGEATEETDALLASLMLCEAHADAFNAPLTWTFIDNRSRNRGESSIPVLSLAHSADRREITALDSTEQGSTEHGSSAQGNEEEIEEVGPGERAAADAAEEAPQPAIPIVRAEDMEDTPLLQRAFRSISS